MSERKDIQRCFENKVKCIAMNLASQFIECNELHWDWDERLREAARERDKALEGLIVQISREHLRVVTEWLVKAVKGYGQDGRDARKALGRNPGCFGTAYQSNYCSKRNGWGDELCQACIAISPLIEED